MVLTSLLYIDIVCSKMVEPKTHKGRRRCQAYSRSADPDVQEGLRLLARLIAEAYVRKLQHPTNSYKGRR